MDFAEPINDRLRHQNIVAFHNNTIPKPLLAKAVALRVLAGMSQGIFKWATTLVHRKFRRPHNDLNVAKMALQ